MSLHQRVYDPEQRDSNVDGSPETFESEAFAEDIQQPFPIDRLPPSAREMAKAICETERVPESLAGCCVLAMLSASIGAGLEVRSGANRTTRANLYIVPSAESGSGKSETVRHACKPLREFETLATTEWRAETQPGLRANTDMLQAELTKLKKAAAACKNQEERKEILQQFAAHHAEFEELQAQMQPPVLIVEDVTTEILVVLLSKRGEMLASISPDAGSIISNLLGRYAKNRTDEAIYLKTWTGEPYRVDRIGRDSVSLKRPCVAALWLVQPDKIDTLLTTNAFMEGGVGASTPSLPHRMSAEADCR